METVDATRPPSRPAGSSHWLKVGVALLVLVSAGVLLMLPPLPAVYPDEVLSEHFRVQELPFDFQVARADCLLTSEVVVALESGDPRATEVTPIGLVTEEAEEVVSVEETAPGEVADTSDAVEASPTASEQAERRERHAREDGTPPSLLYLVRFPREKSKEVLSRVLARHMEIKGDDEDGEQGEGDAQDSSHDDWKLTIDAGQLAWGDYDSDFVLERKYLEDDHFEDVVRVNLTREAQCWVLFAIWPRDYRGSTAPIEQLLAALLPL
jgi:hypothetical protein